MTVPATHNDRPSHPRLDASQLWAGGIATAVVAGLVALVGVLAGRWLFGVAVLAPRSDGAHGDTDANVAGCLNHPEQPET
jgi:hypothetical protein